MKNKQIIPVVLKRKSVLTIVKDVWSLWAKTLGYKISPDDREADIGAAIRTGWVLLHIATCIAIIANAIHHW